MLWAPGKTSAREGQAGPEGADVSGAVAGGPPTEGAGGRSRPGRVSGGAANTEAVRWGCARAVLPPGRLQESP